MATLHLSVPEQGGGGKFRAANSDRGLVLGVGGSRRTGSRARPRRAFFSDSDSDSYEAFQISRKLGLVHVEFFCVLVQQPWIYVGSLKLSKTSKNTIENIHGSIWCFNVSKQLETLVSFNPY